MQDKIMNPVGIEESLLVILLRNQGPTPYYEAELRLVEKMKPARIPPLTLEKAWAAFSTPADR